MKLQELMHFEEKILLCEYHNKFVMPFTDYVILNKLLSEVENITDLYFQLMDEYKKSINKENISNEEKIQKLNDFNQKLLSEEVAFNFKEYESFITKYINEK